MRFVLVFAMLALGAATPSHAAPVHWHTCSTGPSDQLGAALDEAGAACGEVKVPVDYRHPHGRTMTIALARIKVTDRAHRLGTLMINPGGPGAAGMEQVLVGQLMPAVAARYDLVGMDPRFVGRSGPQLCDWPTDTFLRSAGPDRRTFNESVDLARRLAAACDASPYATTLNTARDMDAVRASLGEPKVSYLGFSYGTYLGAVYLQLFGARADRFVLDSAVDPSVYGPALLSRNGPAIDAALRHWAGWAAAHGTGLGATADDVLATVKRIAATADREPLRVGPYRIDGHVLPYVLFAGLYDDSDPAYTEFAGIVATLDAATRGAAAPLSPAFEQFLASVFTGTGAATDRAGTPILCADRAAPRTPDTYFRDISAHRTDEPLFGPLIRNISPCAFWPFPPAEPTPTIHNATAALIVSATGDPAAPYAGQVAMHRALTGSRQVTLPGAFRHGVFLLAANPCVDTTVTSYLLGAPLPRTDTTCT